MSRSILLGTRKGLVVIDRTASGWRPRPIEHAGLPVCYAAADPRDGCLWAAFDHGHWGPKLSRSRDGGRSWESAEVPKYPAGARSIVKYLPTPDFDPASPEGMPQYRDATVLKIWVLAFGSAARPGRIYAGTIPGGLFVSDDGGDHWELNRPLWNHATRGGDLFGADASSDNQWGGTPASIDYGVFEPGIHSIIEDPRDPDHLLVAVSSAGVLESHDGGASWHGRNRGMRNDYLPDPTAEWGHDPHFVTCCPGQPDHLWQQNHCGVFHSAGDGAEWRKVSRTEAGVHFGFPIAADAQHGGTAWVLPARADSSRMAIDEGLFVARTQDGGQTWETFRDGLPQAAAHDIDVPTKRFNEAVKRNLAKFPADFMFTLTAEEFAALRSQFATSNTGRGGRRYLPQVFTEHGALMAATILNSPRAIDVSLFVVRAFVHLRELALTHKDLAKRLDDLEQKTDLLAMQHDTFSRNTRIQLKQVFDAIRELTMPPDPPKQPIGFVPPEEKPRKP